MIGRSLTEIAEGLALGKQKDLLTEVSDLRIQCRAKDDLIQTATNVLEDLENSLESLAKVHDKTTPLSELVHIFSCDHYLLNADIGISIDMALCLHPNTDAFLLREIYDDLENPFNDWEGYSDHTKKILTSLICLHANVPKDLMLQIQEGF